MAVFDPNDWRDGRDWFAFENRREPRPPREINREVVHRWLAAVALCLCFSALGPTEALPLTFAALLVVAALASAVLALVRGERPFDPHLTGWDEAALSLLTGLALALAFAPPVPGTP